MTHPVDAATQQQTIGAFLISLNGVIKILNELEGKEDQNLGVALRDVIRDFLNHPTMSTTAEDQREEQLWKDLGKFVTAETEPILAKTPPLTSSPGSPLQPKHKLYDLIREQRKALLNSTTTADPEPATAVLTTPPAGTPTPPPSGASVSSAGSTPQMMDPYLDPNIQARLQTLLFGNVGALTEITALLSQPPYKFSTPAMVTENLERRFNRGEGWAKQVKDEYKSQSAAAQREAEKVKQQEAKEAAAQARLDARINGAPAPAATTPPPASRRFRRGRSQPASTGPHTSSRWKWGLAGFIIGALAMFAAFGLHLRQTTHVTETNNNVVIKDETVDEMYSWMVILSASAGMGIVFGLAFVGISSIIDRKEKGP